MRNRRDARFTAGEFAGKYLVAEAVQSGSIIALICDDDDGRLRVLGDLWFADLDDLEAAMTEDDWEVEWLPEGSLAPIRPRDHDHEH